MIEVDISRVWSCFSLPELLMLEREVFDAHMALPGTVAGGVIPSPQELERIRAYADRLREDAQTVLVLGSSGSVQAAQAAIELLQGPDHDQGKGLGDPELLFAGRSLSTRHWYELLRLTEGKGLYVICVSATGREPAFGLNFRGIREELEKRLGREEADRRICVITEDRDTPLRVMTRERGWEYFPQPACPAYFGAFSPAALLIMAVAGLNILELLRGCGEGSAAWDLRSFENPLWLYCAVRNLMHRSGRGTEVLTGFEPGLDAFGSWWQQLFCGAEGKDGKGILPVWQTCSGDFRGLSGLLRSSGDRMFETVLRFDPPDLSYALRGENGDPDGFNYLAGETLGDVNERVMAAVMDSHEDGGCGVISIDCGALTPRKLGGLFAFMELAAALSAGIQGVDPMDEAAGDGCRTQVLARLGAPASGSDLSDAREKSGGNS